MHGENIVDLIADPSELATNGGNIIRPQFEAGRRQQVPETECTGRDACDALTEAAPRGRTSAGSQAVSQPRNVSSSATNPRTARQHTTPLHHPITPPSAPHTTNAPRATAAQPASPTPPGATPRQMSTSPGPAARPPRPTTNHRADTAGPTRRQTAAPRPLTTRQPPAPAPALPTASAGRAAGSVRGSVWA